MGSDIVPVFLNVTGRSGSISNRDQTDERKRCSCFVKTGRSTGPRLMALWQSPGAVSPKV